MVDSQDFLQPEEAHFWNWSRLYYAKVAEILIPTRNRVKAAMLCLPSFEPEWLISIEHKTWHQQQQSEGEYFLRLSMAEPQIWPLHYESPHNWNLPVEAQTTRISLDANFVETIYAPWLSILEKVVPSSNICLDGETYHFMAAPENPEGHSLELVGQTHSPDDKSRPGQLVAICDDLRALVLSEPAEHEQRKSSLRQKALHLAEQLRSGA